MKPCDDSFPGLPGGRLASSRPTSRSPQESSQEQAWERVAGSDATSKISRSGPRHGTNGLGWLILIPVACCGGPLIFAAIAAAAGAAAWGGLGALAAITLGIAVVVVMRRRRTASCCPSTETSKATRQATHGPDTR